MTGAPQGAHGRSSRIDCYQLLINLCHVYVTSLWFVFCPLGLHVFLFADSWSTIHRFVLPYPSQRGQGSTCSQTDLDEAAVAKRICEVLWNDGYPEYCRNYIEYNQTSRTGLRHGATGMCVGGNAIQRSYYCIRCPRMPWFLLVKSPSLLIQPIPLWESVTFWIHFR